VLGACRQLSPWQAGGARFPFGVNLRHGSRVFIQSGLR
jgi:hypothetical protein